MQEIVLRKIETKQDTIKPNKKKSNLTEDQTTTKMITKQKFNKTYRDKTEQNAYSKNCIIKHNYNLQRRRGEKERKRAWLGTEKGDKKKQERQRPESSQKHRNRHKGTRYDLSLTNLSFPIRIFYVDVLSPRYKSTLLQELNGNTVMRMRKDWRTLE